MEFLNKEILITLEMMIITIEMMIMIIRVEMMIITNNNIKMITFLCFLCLMLAVRLSVGWNRLRLGLGAGLELAWADFTLLVSRSSGLTKNVHVVIIML